MGQLRTANKRHKRAMARRIAASAKPAAAIVTIPALDKAAA